MGHVWNVCYVAANGYSLYVGKGCVEFGYDWGWIRRRMFRDNRVIYGWTLKRALPTWTYDRVRADWRVPTWLCFAALAGFTVFFWHRRRLFGLPELKYRYPLVLWWSVVLALSAMLPYGQTSEYFIDENLAVAAMGLSVFLLAPPVLAVRLVEVLTEHFRIPHGYCRKCRYNLTGNVSGICPECGTPIRPATGSEDHRLSDSGHA